MNKIQTDKWEFATEAATTAEVMREYFDNHGYRSAVKLDKAHWQLIILALERAAE